MIQSYLVLKYRSHWICSEPKLKDDKILPHSRVPKSPDPFWTKVQGWYNPTTFSSTKVTRSILNRSSRMIQSYYVLEYRSHQILMNRSSRMIQSYHVLEYWSHRIHSELKFKDDTILPHSRVPKSPDPFWIEAQGWYNPATFSRTEVIRFIMDVCPGMIQSLFILGDRGH